MSLNVCVSRGICLYDIEEHLLARNVIHNGIQTPECCESGKVPEILRIVIKPYPGKDIYFLLASNQSANIWISYTASFP